MTKIICVGDIHVMDRPPVNATESYTDDIIDMLHWVAGHAQEIGADAVVWAGDIFHHKAPSRTSHALVQRMIAVVQDYAHLGVELLCVTGNHDVQNDRLDSLDKQPLGVLYAAGLKPLDGWHPTLPLFGVPWRQDWTTNEDAAWEAFEFWRTDGFQPRSLAVTHAPIYPPGQDQNQMFALVPTVKISPAMENQGFLYYGHIHDDHGIFEVEGVTYCNVGAISRGSMTEYNLEREIKIAVWDDELDDTGHRGGFTEVVVPHKPASEVFKIEQAVEAKQGQMDLDQFLSDIGSTTIDITSTRSVIEHIQGRPDITPRVKTLSISILEELE